ncbi:MAG: DNA translocase FtsK [Elusimicrobiota bacterium]|nr:DNA translocase FtsK [Elusimicrobiota bacterium]
MARKKSSKNTKHKNRDIVALFFALTAFISAYSILLPDGSGVFGKAFSNVVNSIFGAGSYFIPIALLWFFVLRIAPSLNHSTKIDFLWSLISAVSLSTLFLSANAVFGSTLYGGWIGIHLYPFVEKLLGSVLSFCVLALLLGFSSAFLFRVPLVSLLKKLFISEKSADDTDTKDEPSGKKRQQQPEPELIFNGPDDEGGKEDYSQPNIIAAKKSKKERFSRPAEKIDSSDIDYILPSTETLMEDKPIDYDENKRDLLARADLMKKTLAEFGIEVEVKDIIAGPVVTRYDLTLAPGLKIQSIMGVIDNISLAMRTPAIRIVPIPEKGAVGIEVPNPESVIVGLRGVIESEAFAGSDSKLSLALGETTDGKGYTAELDSMPHLLIAGATGSGKSVALHSIILSILFKARPDEVKFMIIDPKRVEMPIYKDIPHIYHPCTRAADADIITDPKESAAALKKLVTVMNARYDKYADNMVRNIEEYNAKMELIGGEKEFYIVVVIDELADLMLVVQKEIEDSIQRLAQMARAVGIHLILATQRPSVNVITGVIKANFPARMSFQTASKVDSRVILDALGADSLIGKGDMLFLPPQESRPIRLQGAYVSLKEIKSIVDFISGQDFPRVYEPPIEEVEREEGFKADKSKELLPVLMLMRERGRISQDLLKANFGGSAKATNILSLLETQRFIAKPQGTNKWQINWSKVNEYLDIQGEGNE